MAAEMEGQEMDAVQLHENVVEGVQCYALAIRLYTRMHRHAFAATLHSEVGNALQVFGMLDEAAAHFQAAAELLGTGVPAVAALETAADCAIRGQNYDRALDLMGALAAALRATLEGTAPPEAAAAAEPGDDFCELARLCPPGAYRDTLGRCEVTTVLLLLLLDSAAARERWGPMLARYRTGARSTAAYLSGAVEGAVQSVVLAAEGRDVDSLRELQGELWGSLTPLQNELLLNLPRAAAL